VFALAPVSFTLTLEGVRTQWKPARNRALEGKAYSGIRDRIVKRATETSPGIPDNAPAVRWPIDYSGMKRIIALLLLTAAGGTFAGQTVYVDDRLEVMLRTGKGTAFQILRVLPSGTPLELLKADGDYTQVRTSQGVEGWVLSRFLT